MNTWWMKIGLAFAVILVIWVIIAPGCLQFRVTDTDSREQFSRYGVDLKTGFFRVNGRNLHYALTGADTLPTLFFIHGSPGSWGSFATFMRDSTLLQHFRMVSIDRPGFGQSDFGKAEPLPIQSKLIAPLILELGNGHPMYLVGHSLGGPLIIQLAADLDDRINGLVMLAGSVDPAYEPKENWRRIMEVFPLRHLLPGSFKPSNTELLAFKKDILELAGAFDKVHGEVYILHGKKDGFVPVENAYYAEKKLVNASRVKTIIFPKDGHMIPWTRFREIRDVLLQLHSR